MKRIVLILVAAAFFPVVSMAQEECFGVSCMPKEIQESCSQQMDFGCFDEKAQVIYATGMGVPNMKYPSVAQRRYSAMTAAKVVAIRNLLQVIEETRLTSSQSVSMGMLEKDEIKTLIEGSVKNIVQPMPPKFMSDGSAWVTLKMYLKDIMR